MKQVIKTKDKIYEYDRPEKYYFRSIKFSSSDQVKKFSAFCRENESNLRKEINTAVNYVIENKILLSEILEKFTESINNKNNITKGV